MPGVKYCVLCSAEYRDDYQHMLRLRSSPCRAGGVGQYPPGARAGDGRGVSPGKDRQRTSLPQTFLRDALEKEGIPVIVRSFSETSFDGIFIPQKGWGLILVPKELCDRAQQIISSIEMSLPSQSDQ